jgi:predicted unusual protein kinase regulating ubiquinone biosynthesis (AarF/ABC1/UbiB family)
MYPPQLHQILIDGFFHADPHPGNSIAQAGNVLCFYDVGMVGHPDENQRRGKARSAIAATCPILFRICILYTEYS